MTDAPPRIWTWPYTTQTGLSASASGTFRADPWRPLDDRKGPTGQEYIRLDLHEAAVAAARAEGEAVLAAAKAVLKEFGGFKWVNDEEMRGGGYFSPAGRMIDTAPLDGLAKAVAAAEASK